MFIVAAVVFLPNNFMAGLGTLLVQGKQNCVTGSDHTTPCDTFRACVEMAIGQSQPQHPTTLQQCGPYPTAVLRCEATSADLQGMQGRMASTCRWNAAWRSS